MMPFLHEMHWGFCATLMRSTLLSRFVMHSRSLIMLGHRAWIGQFIHRLRERANKERPLRSLGGKHRRILSVIEPSQGAEQLEERTLLAATLTATLDGSNNLVITDSAGTQNNALTIRRSGSNLVISDVTQQFAASSIAGAVLSVGDQVITIPAASIGGTQILVDAQGGIDSLTVNLTTDLGFDVSYAGGTGTSDSLTLTGSTVTSVAHTATNANDGSIVVVSGVTRTISYIGLEPITDNLSATDRVFTFNGGAETISLTDASGSKMTIDSTHSESITFTNPTGSLTINAGTGDDTVTITSVDAAYNADLIINGDADTDTINLNGDITFAAGESLLVTAEAVNVGTNSDLTTSGAGAITLTADAIEIDSTALVTSASTVTLKPQTIGRAINLGTAQQNVVTYTMSGYIEPENLAVNPWGLSGDGSAGTPTDGAAYSLTIVVAADAVDRDTINSGFASFFPLSVSLTINGQAATIVAHDNGNSGGLNLQDNSAGGVFDNVQFDGDVTFLGNTQHILFDQRIATSSFSLLATPGTDLPVTFASTTAIQTGGASVNSAYKSVAVSGTPVTADAGTQADTSAFSLTDAELDRITTGTLAIGDTSSGSITFTTDIDRTTSTNIVLTTGTNENIVLGQFSLNAGPAGDIFLTTSGTGSISTSNNTGNDLTGDDVVLVAGSGGIGIGANFVRLNANTISAVTTGGIQGYYLADLDTITIAAGGLNGGTFNGLGGGTFVLSSSEQIADDDIILLSNNATVMLNGFNETVRTFSGDSTSSIINGSATPATLTLADTGVGYNLASTFGGATANDNNFAVHKSGTGNAYIWGNSTHTGTTTIGAGYWRVNGSLASGSAVTVQNTGILGGTGTVAGTVAVQNGGHLAPGSSPVPNSGILNTGSIDFASGSFFDVEIDGTAGAGVSGGHDRLDVTGTVSLGGANLDVSLNYVPTSGDSFVIINNDGSDAVTGTFMVGGVAIPNLGVFAVGSSYFRVNYAGGDGNDVVLTETTAANLDFGDAPTAAQTGFTASYPVTVTDDGARHASVGPQLGTLRDDDSVAAPSANADGDDIANLDDEDGISFVTSIMRSPTANTAASIVVSLVNPDAISNQFSGWIDFNRDGDWSDSGEHIFDNVDLGTSAGDVVLSFTIRSGSIIGDTFARFRLSSAGQSDVTGLAADGEVEDYKLTVINSSTPALVDVPAAGSGDIYTSLEGANIVVRQGGSSGTILLQAPVSEATQITINGLDNVSENFVVDFTSGSPIPSGGLNIDGGAAGNDMLQVAGHGEHAVYTPDALVTGAGIVTVDGTAMINFTGLEPLDLFGFATATIDLPNGDDVLAMTNDVDFTLGGVNSAIRIAGTSGGIPIETVAVWNTTTLIIDTALTLDGDDSITLTGADATSASITNLTINSGSGADSFVLDGNAILSGNFVVTTSASILQAGTSTLAIGGTTNINTGSAAITLNTSTNDFGGAVTLTGGVVSIVDANDLTLASVTVSSVLATANDALTLTGALVADAGLVTLHANSDGVGADDFSMQAGSSIVTTNDTANAVSISVNTLLGGTGDATLAEINAGTTAGPVGGRVTVAALDGRILDGNGATLNITAGNALLRAEGGVGTLANSLETSVTQLEGSGGSGGFYLDNYGALTIGGLTGVVGVSTTTGDIRIIAHSPLTVIEDVIGGGFVFLHAGETAGTGDDLTIIGGVTVRSNANNVDLEAGDDVYLNAGSLIEAPTGTVFIKGDCANADALGSNIIIDGLINSANGATVNGDSDDDFISVTAMGTGGLLLDGLAGNDNYSLTYPDLPTTFGSTITINDSLGGTDQVTVNGTLGPDELFLTTQDPPTTATTEELSRGAIGTERIVLHNNIEHLSVFLLDDIDVMHAQPSKLFPVFLHGGEPCFGDPGVPPGDQLIFDPFGNTFSISGNTISTDGGYQGVSFTDFESMPLAPLGAPPGGQLLLDFNHTNTASGHATSPTQAGYIGVPQTTVYSGGLGYGWQFPVKSFERDDGFYGNTYADLTRDGHWLDAAATFTVDLPVGWYLVSAMVGSPYTAISGAAIKNADTGGTLVANIVTDPGESKPYAFAVFVADGTLDLQFVHAVNYPKIFAVNGLSIRPGELLSMGLDCPPGGNGADGVTIDTFTLYEAPPNSLITITASNGTIMNVDQDDELDGIQIRANALGQATVDLRRPTGAGTVILTFEEVTGAKTGVSSVEYVSPSTRLIDFNNVNRTSSTGQSPTQAPVASIGFPDGFNGVPQSQIYSTLNGLGWLTSPSGFDLGGLTNSQGEAVTDPHPLANLRRDGAFNNTPRTFRIDLPDGSYTYTATIGYDRDIDGMQINANGSIISGISVAAGQRQQINGTFTVAGGFATFTFSDAGGTAPNWVINGLEIRPVITVAPIIFTPNIGATPADGLTITPVRAITGLADGEQVTVTTSLGTIVTPDVNPTVDGIQVYVTGGQVLFDVLAPTIPGTPTFTATSLDGSHAGTISAASFVNYVIPTGRRFDFNHLRSSSSTGPSKTAVGFVGVLRTDLDRVGDGFGWNIAPNSYDNAVFNEFDNTTFPQLTTALYSDVHSGHITLGSRTFSVQAKPGTSYDLTVYLGGVCHDMSTQVLVEGIALPQSLNLGANHFDFLQFAGAFDADNDGFIEITFSSTGTPSPFWSVNGLDIVEAGSGLPLPAPLTARDQGTGFGVDDLTQSELQVVYQAALNLWASTELSEEDFDLISNVQFVIRDLGNVGGLAILDGNRVINIDDDGAGHGWGLQLDKPLADRYDLLTAIAHELGHLLGHDDLNPLTAGADVMNAFLGLGDRHLEGIDAYFS